MSAAPLPAPLSSSRSPLPPLPGAAVASFSSSSPQLDAAPPARAESHRAAAFPPPPRMDQLTSQQQQQQLHHRRQDDGRYLPTEAPYASATPAWMSTSSAYPASYLQEEKRLGTAGSGSLDRILHSRGAGAFDDERQQTQDSGNASPNAGGLLTPLSHPSQSTGERDSAAAQVTTTTWGEEPSTTAAAAAAARQRVGHALPSPADTQSSGVSWGPPPTQPLEAGSYLRPQWSAMPAPHSLYPLTPHNHTPLPSLANDPRLYVDDHDYYPPVNLLPPSISIPVSGGQSQDAQEAFRYHASLQNPTSVDFQLQQPLPSIVPYGHDDRLQQRSSALTPPPSSTHTSGASSAREEDGDRPVKRHKQTSLVAIGRSSSSGASSIQSGKVLKTDRPFACDVCTQSFNRRHDLTRHHRTHEEERPWPCTNCTKAFTRKDALRRHLLVKKECGLVVELPKSAAAMRRDREARKQAESSRRSKDGSAGDSVSGDEDRAETDSGRAYSQPTQQQQTQQQQQHPPVDGYVQHRMMPAPLMLPSPPVPYAEHPPAQYQPQQYALQHVPYGQAQYMPDGRYAYGNEQDLRPSQPSAVDLTYEAASPQQAYHQSIGVHHPPPAIHHPGSSNSSTATLSRQGSDSSDRVGRPAHSRHSSIQSAHSSHSMHPTLSTGVHSQHGSVSPGGHHNGGGGSTLSPHPPQGPTNPAVSPALSQSSSFYGHHQQQQQQQQGGSPLPPGVSPGLPASRSPYMPSPAPAMSGLGINGVQLPSVQYAADGQQLHHLGQGIYSGESARLPPPQAYYATPPQPQQQAHFAGPHGFAQQQQQDGGSPYMHSAGPAQQQQQAEWYPPPLTHPFQEAANAY